MNFEQREILMKWFLKATYSIIITPLTGCLGYAKTKPYHERAVRLVYNDPISTLEELLQRKKSHRAHHKNIQRVVIELYETKYSRMNQVKFVEDSLITSGFFKAVFHKFYLVHS